MKGRSVREFVYKGDLWAIVESWAAEAGFAPLEEGEARRLYRRSGRLFMAPAFLEIRRQQGKVTLEAWVQADFFLVVSILTGKKPESALAAGGLTAAVPRKLAREKVNLLLKRLGQPPID